VASGDGARLRAEDAPVPSVTATRRALNDPGPGEAVERFRVALVTMPFGRFQWYRPSIQVGTLKAIAQRAGFPVQDHYLGLDLAVELGFDLYEAIQSVPCTGFTAEWVFTIAAFGDDANREDYFATFPDEAVRIRTWSGKDAAFMNDLRERVIPEFIDKCLAGIDWSSYNAVCFLSTFQQHIASLALARRIKERFPHVTTIFAGANMDGEMGLEHMRAFACIDFGLSGEADATFPELLTRLAEGRETDDLLGLAARCGDGRVSFAGPAEPFRDMDNLPAPDYDTYYEAMQRHGVDKYADSIPFKDREFQVRAVPFEGSRGCWWGEKSQCTFCGGNLTGIAYRSKSPDRALEEIDELYRRYGRKDFWAIDNILDPKYITEFFGPLAERGDGFRFFFYTKANLKREQVRQLARGGVFIIWPGIESLNTRILKLMRKGVTRLQNVNLLRWCAYYHVDVHWFLLYGFPGEQPEDYAEQLQTMRLMTFTRPPIDEARLRIERFSPYFYDKRLFPTKWRRPCEEYAFIYPPHINLDEAAYFFDYELECEVLPEEAHREMHEFTAQWRHQWYTGQRASLTFSRNGLEILIEDTRFGLDRPRSYALGGLDAQVYEACSTTPRTAAQMRSAQSAESPGIDADEQSVIAACDDLCEAGLMIGEGGKYLSLAIPAEPER